MEAPLIVAVSQQKHTGRISNRKVNGGIAAFNGQGFCEVFCKISAYRIESGGEFGTRGLGGAGRVAD